MRMTKSLVAVATAILAMGLMAPAASAIEDQSPIGFHDGLNGTVRRGECVAAGWAVDPDSPSSRVTVRISVDGTLLTTVTADQFRQDLLDAGVSPDGYSSFYVFMGLLGITFDANHSVLIEAQDVETLDWTPLGSTPQSILCSNLLGYHDGNAGEVGRDDCIATGWAADADTYGGPRAEVRVKVDGRVVATTTANQFRQDLLDAGIGDGYSGFSVDLFGMVTPGRAHVVTAEMRDTTLKRIWLPLFETGKTLTCFAGPPPQV